MQWLGGGRVLLVLKEPLSFFCHVVLPVIWSKSKSVLWLDIIYAAHYSYEQLQQPTNAHKTIQSMHNIASIVLVQ